MEELEHLGPSPTMAAPKSIDPREDLNSSSSNGARQQVKLNLAIHSLPKQITAATHVYTCSLQ